MVTSWALVFSQEWTSYEVDFDDNSMLGWVHADETATLRPDYRNWPDRADAFIRSVPWDDDGRFLCVDLHWVRTGFGRCPFCSNPVRYKYMVAHNYLLQSFQSRIIENSLWSNGFKLTVRGHDTLSRKQD
eukprot:4851701-Pyramimonas_sp.AAC.1